MTCYNLNLPSYSIAIRTLGTAGEKFRRELESIRIQTVQPEKVVVYIAEGHSRPEFTVGSEEYVWVPKGMMAQRVLPYDEITSECILMLDDDVELAPDSAEKMLLALEENAADCVGADVFQNHKLPLWTKVYAAITNLVFPHRSRKWAFKIHRNGAFSYNIHPDKPFYWSQSCGGPAALWRKECFLGLHLEDELWLESLGFPYGEDALTYYKLHLGGGRLGILYDSGVVNLDAQSSSGAFRKSAEHIYIRTKASLMIWWRSCYKTGKDSVRSRFLAASAFAFKTIWLIPVMGAAAIIYRNPHYIGSYFRGIKDGLQEIHSPSFQNLPPYQIETKSMKNNDTQNITTCRKP